LRRQRPPRIPVRPTQHPLLVGRDHFVTPREQLVTPRRRIDSRQVLSLWQRPSTPQPVSLCTTPFTAAKTVASTPMVHSETTPSTPRIRSRPPGGAQGAAWRAAAAMRSIDRPLEGLHTDRPMSARPQTPRMPGSASAHRPASAHLQSVMRARATTR
jgi:hypothetical protein